MLAIKLFSFEVTLSQMCNSPYFFNAQQFEIKGKQFVFKEFRSDEEIDLVVDSLKELLTKIEKYIEHSKS